MSPSLPCELPDDACSSRRSFGETKRSIRDGREEENPRDRIRQVAWTLYWRAQYKGSTRPTRSHATGQKRGPADVRVLARVFVRELMADSGLWKALFPLERRRGKKLWFRARRGSSRDSRHRPRRGEGGGEVAWFIGDYAGDIGTYAFFLTFRGKPPW